MVKLICEIHHHTLQVQKNSFQSRVLLFSVEPGLQSPGRMDGVPTKHSGGWQSDIRVSTGPYCPEGAGESAPSNQSPAFWLFLASGSRNTAEPSVCTCVQISHLSKDPSPTE